MELIIMLPLLIAVAIYGINYYVKDRSRQHKKLALALAYERLVMKHKLSIEDVDVFDNRIIALDRKNKQLLFLNHSGNNPQEELLLLPQVAQSQIVEVRDESKGLLKKVCLELTHKVDSATSILCFYDEQQDRPTVLLPLMRKARHWKQRLEGNINPGISTVEAAPVLSKKKKISIK